MKNVSDIIEQYIKEVLQNEQVIELKRSELADRFQCVPSQINYVLKTRFSIERGYIVESKRGGGGYIRVIKVTLAEESDLIDEMLGYIEERITQNLAQSVILRLMEERIINRREARLMLSAIDRSVLDLSIPLRDAVRANILRAMVLAIKYKM